MGRAIKKKFHKKRKLEKPIMGRIDRIHSMPPNKAYYEGFDRIWGKEEKDGEQDPKGDS